MINLEWNKLRYQYNTLFVEVLENVLEHKRIITQRIKI